MDRIRDYLRGFCVLLSDMAVVCLIFYMVPTFTKIQTVSIPVFVWVLFILMQMLADYIMTGMGISFNLYLIGNAAALLAGTYFIVNGSYCPEGFSMFPAFLSCGAVAVGIHGAAAAWRLPSANSILRYVDGLVVLLAFYLYAVFDTYLEPAQEVILLSLSAMFLDLVCVNQIRTREEGVSVIQGSGAGSRLVLAVVSGAIVIVTGVVTGTASGQVHSAVDVLLLVMKSIGHILYVIFQAIGFVLAKILYLLALLLPDAPQETEKAIKMTMQEEIGETADAAVWRLPDWVLWVFLTAVLIFAVCFILYRFRSFRIKRVKRENVKKRVVRKNHFFTAMIQGARKIWDLAQFEYLFRKYQKTPEGLLVCAERIGKQKKMPRQRWESPGEYLRRIAAWMRTEKADMARENADGSDADALDALAGVLDRIYYGSVQEKCRREELFRYEEAIKNLKKMSS